jgi:hypothetical protein
VGDSEQEKKIEREGKRNVGREKRKNYFGYEKYLILHVSEMEYLHKVAALLQGLREIPRLSCNINKLQCF